jgi:hypothetical protein
MALSSNHLAYTIVQNNDIKANTSIIDSFINYKQEHFIPLLYLFATCKSLYC